MPNPRLSFIVPVNKEEVLARNVLASKIYRDGNHQFLFQRGYTNVPKAYNDAIPAAESGLLLFCHQDVFFPDTWEDEFFASLRAVTALDPNWGVLGAAGVRLTRRFFGARLGVEFIGNFSTNVAGGAYVIDHFRPKTFPQRIDTLDEFLLVVRRPHAVFDERIPNNHFYGADLCLRCAAQGLHSYAISAFVHHDSTSRWVQSDFYESAGYMYTKYRAALPIATTCTIIEDKNGTASFRSDFLAILSMTLHSLMRRRRIPRRPA